MQAEELKGASGEAVKERQGHEPAAWPNASSLVKPCVELLDPTAVELANLCSDTIGEAQVAAESGLSRVGTDTQLCFNFLNYAGLSL